MKFRRTVTFSVLGLFVILQIYLLFIKQSPVLDFPNYKNNNPVQFYEKEEKSKKISQSFRTPGPLVRVDIMLANNELKPKGGTLQFSIFKKKQCLYLKNYPANTVEDNQFYRFKIRGKNIPAGEYLLNLKYVPQDKKERLAVWSFNEDIYPHGNLIINGKRESGDMTFRIYYKSSIWQQRHKILSFPPFLGRGTSLTLGFIFLFFVVNFLFYFFIDTLLKEPDIYD
jgi:hypothetical protein